MDRDYAVEAEATPENLERLKALVRSRLREEEFHLYPAIVDEVLAQIVIDELVVLRKRVGLMLDLVRERYAGRGMTDCQLERAAFVLLCHRVDADGEIDLPSDLEES